MAAPITPTVQAAFARFWAAYPPRRPNPSAPARQVFADLVKAGEDPEALIDAAGRFADLVRVERINSVFVPHARRWLAKREFEDFLTPDVPVSADIDQPRPEHPLDWMRATMTAAAWSAWIERLAVETTDTGVIITAPTRFVRDRVIQDHGPAIRRQYGAVEWRIARDV